MNSTPRAPHLKSMSTGEFRLSITVALRDQLKDALAQLSTSRLDTAGLKDVLPRGGIYELWLDGKCVYVGKAKSNLSGRLEQHRRKIFGRTGLPDRMEFKCLYVVEDLDAMAPERMLLDAYKSEGAGEAAWNTNGFGNKDPGIKRDRSTIGIGHFDAKHPIDLDLKPFVLAGLPPVSVHQLLLALKSQLPYLFRFPNRAGKDKSELQHATVDAIDWGQPRSLSEWLEVALAPLPAGWQATALPGYLIMYFEPVADAYESAQRYWRSEDGSVRRVDLIPTFDPNGVVEAIFEDEDEDDDGESSEY